MVTSDRLVVDFTQQNGALKLYPEAPLLSSDQAGWEGLQLHYHRQPAYEMVEHSCRQHRIIIHDRTLKSPMLAAIGEAPQLTKISCGTITVVPANARNWACWDAEHQFIVLAVEPNRLKQDSAEITDGNDVELLPTLSHIDPLIYSIGLALKTELESNETGGHLYRDAMKSALLAQLLRHYSVQEHAPLAVTSSLSTDKLQQVTDYIHNHLDQDLALATLAAVVQMSPSYFSGSFKQSIGLAPHQYVIQCKIERAKQLLLQNKLTIAEIAHTLGFSHQSHLSRHFKRLVGFTPKAFLKSQ